MKIFSVIALTVLMSVPALAQYQGHRENYRITPGCPNGICPQVSPAPVPPPAHVPEHPHGYGSSSPSPYLAPGPVYRDDVDDIIESVIHVVRAIRRQYKEERELRRYAPPPFYR